MIPRVAAKPAPPASEMAAVTQPAVQDAPVGNDAASCPPPKRLHGPAHHYNGSSSIAGTPASTPAAPPPPAEASLAPNTFAAASAQQQPTSQSDSPSRPSEHVCKRASISAVTNNSRESSPDWSVTTLATVAPACGRTAFVGNPDIDARGCDGTAREDEVWLHDRGAVFYRGNAATGDLARAANGLSRN